MKNQIKKSIVDFTPAGYKSGQNNKNNQNQKSGNQSIDEQKEMNRINYILSLRKTVEPLSKEYFLEVLQLEERIMFDDNYSSENIAHLVELYAKAVEHYDSLKDPISVYFLEKIQMTLASHETLQLMHQKRKKIRDSISRFESMGKSQLSQVLDENDNDLWDMGNSSIYKSRLKLPSSQGIVQGPSDFYQKKNQYKKLVKQEKDQRYSISKKKRERQKKIEQYQEQKNFYEKNNSETMVKLSEINSQKINNIIQSDLDKQESSVLERLKLRKYQKQLTNSRKRQEEIEQNQENQEIEQFQQYQNKQEENTLQNEIDQNMPNNESNPFKNIDHNQFYNEDSENKKEVQFMDDFNDLEQFQQNKIKEDSNEDTQTDGPESNNNIQQSLQSEENLQQLQQDQEENAGEKNTNSNLSSQNESNSKQRVSIIEDDLECPQKENIQQQQ